MVTLWVGIRCSLHWVCELLTVSGQWSLTTDKTKTFFLQVSTQTSMSSRLGGEEGARTRTHMHTQPLHPQPMQTQPPRGKNTDRMGPSAGHKRHNIKDICSKSIYPEHLISKKIYIYKQNLQKQKLMMRFDMRLKCKFPDPWMNAAITTCHFSSEQWQHPKRYLHDRSVMPLCRGGGS